ncbi:fimbria/pilus periplasmic chaperone [Hafnia paralvei]|uniref:Fimbrial chaperone protein FimC n=1 Tax=Hafnia paralvei TaxID=546367 RepID=A0A4Q9EC94_9GAMM|nr:fimbria/pilus periplasmic chaperone [Hafnia paralvei]TBM21017.1 fimbrial chaperone protein FimC [Hafnia paralvei]
MYKKSIKGCRLTPFVFGIALLFATAQYACAGGVSLGGTRIIYPQGADQVSLAVSNSDAKNTFLIQSWVSEENSKKSADFVVTPPLFVIQPNKENTLRIMFVSTKTLPDDRESLYYFNSKAIPASGPRTEGRNTLQIASQSIIKLFVRPANLPSSPVDAPQTLTCHLSGTDLKITNPSPYYITLVNIDLAGGKLPDAMISPKSSQHFTIKNDGKIKFQTINDFGTRTAEQTCNIK